MDRFRGSHKFGGHRVVLLTREPYIKQETHPTTMMEKYIISMIQINSAYSVLSIVTALQTRSEVDS